MKKLICLLLCVSACAALLAGCGSAPEKQDGQYRAEYAQFDEYGWKDYVTVTVEENKVTAVEFDAVNELGEKKSENASYRESMEAITKTYPEKFCAEYGEQYIEKQEAKDLDAIAGATKSHDSLVTLLSALQKPMEEGNTDPVTVTAEEK